MHLSTVFRRLFWTNLGIYRPMRCNLDMWFLTRIDSKPILVPMVIGETMDAETEFLGVPEALAVLDVNRARLYQLIKAGRLGRKLGGHYVFTRAELERYKQERAQRPKGGRPKVRAGTIPA